MDTPNSDIDTKLITIPTFEEICFNKKPLSTTHIRENDEHIDMKDIRLYFQCFRKQNINFMEILFTPYKIVIPDYEKEWELLVAYREEIAHYNPVAAVKCMKGAALEKYYAMEHPYPSKLALIEQYGYDAKQLHHLLRYNEFLQRYMAGEPYIKCLKPNDANYFAEVKAYKYNLIEARELAKETIDQLTIIADDFRNNTEDKCDEDVENLLNNVQYDIIKKSMKKELF